MSKQLHRVGQSEVARLPRQDVANERETRTRELLQTAADTDDEVELRRLHDEIVLLNVEIAESIVMRYRNRGVAVEDLVQVACLGLVKAARGFDPDKSDNFLGYAVPTILGEVKRFFRDNAWAVRPPRRIQELQAQISATGAELMHRLGRVPTAAEIAEALGIESTEVAEALAADGCFSPTSLDRPTGDGDGAPLSDVLSSNEGGFDQAEAVIALSPICRALPERDRRIIYLRFFHEWTQARIAQEFGVTQMQVSRLLTRILQQLREQLGSMDDPGPANPDRRIAS
ncbi:MAG: SigB/SigF/SigG family RNA polymerase sigma factor [Propionibacteriales bacterium]|nr:SigB/SigF/SigG family RNA polymerase sigma factor [Propionibacteriales bacterium]